MTALPLPFHGDSSSFNRLACRRLLHVLLCLHILHAGSNCKVAWVLYSPFHSIGHSNQSGLWIRVCKTKCYSSLNSSQSTETLGPVERG
ncbi:hypothetical protein F5X98DRAFT_325300 [Xylaria grammica]|nr:hypothetical protein F5X98DRAFT_325300 [Xylaria grammica]